MERFGCGSKSADGAKKRGRSRCTAGFFFSSRIRHTRYWLDWSSDVCSSDLDNKAVILRNHGLLSIVMNQKMAESTLWPTVSRPWLRRMTALLSPRACAMRFASSTSLKIGRASCRDRVWMSQGGGVVEERLVP